MRRSKIILYIYKNELCDPVRNVGVCRKFGAAADLDAYMKTFVASVDPQYMSNYRIFITNDNIEFAAVDHYVLMDDNYNLDIISKGIDEVNIKEIALEVNTMFAANEKRRAKEKKRAKEQSDRRIKAHKEKDPD